MKDMKEKKKKNKPKYNMWQNTNFMIKCAIKEKEKKVLVMILLITFSTIAINLLNLMVVPSLLSLIEEKVEILNLIMIILIYIGGLAFFNGFLSYLNTNKLFGRIAIRMSLISMVNNKTLTTSYPNLADENLRVLLSKTSNNTLASNSSSGEAIWETLNNILINIVGFIIYTILFLNLNIILIGVIVVTSLLNYLVSNWLSKYRYVHQEEESKVINNMFYITSQARDWKASKDIRIFGLKSWFDEIYSKAKRSYISFQNKAESRYLWASILDVVLTFLRNGLAYFFLIKMIFNGSINVSEFILFFSAVSGFSDWVLGILNNFNVLYRQSLDISILRECLDYKEPFKFEDGKKLEVKNIPYEIELKNVSFLYPNTENEILKNINLKLSYKEKLAVVGLNGAGKTTLIKLICGFLDPTSGEVLLNGQDIRKYNRNDYYRLFSAVFQNFSILPESIAINVSQNDKDYDLEKVKECIEKAGLKEKIESLDKKYETKLNRSVYYDAIMLSGGQTQRLMLARALYKDAPFVILDEPTASLDPIAESKIYQSYSDMTKNKSSIFISHRLASTRFCDRIILIDEGEIKEEGTHEDLIKKQGKYYQLFQVQSKYYKEDEENEENLEF